MDEIAPVAPPDSPQQPPPTPTLPFRRPADYYSAPAEEVRPLFPTWVPYGCGGSAILALLLVFGIGYAMLHGAMGAFLELTIGSMEVEIDKMLTAEVKPPQKAAFDQEMKTLRDSVRQNRVDLQRLQPLLRTIREVSIDEKVTPAEAEQLTRELRDLNRTPKH